MYQYDWYCTLDHLVWNQFERKLILAVQTMKNESGYARNQICAGSLNKLPNSTGLKVVLK